MATKPIPEQRLLAQIADRLPGLCTRLQAAGCGDVDADDPAAGDRDRGLGLLPVDPHAALDELAAHDEVPTIPWQDCGPATMKVGWDHLRHDSGLVAGVADDRRPELAGAGDDVGSSC